MKIRRYLMCGFLLMALCLSSCARGSFLQSREIKQGEEGADSKEQAGDTGRGENSGTNQTEGDRTDTGGIWVQIQGAVERPGVYSLPRDSRLKDLLEAAGGFGRDADTEKVNQAARLEDGAMYRVPRQGEGQNSSEEGQSSENAQTGSGSSSKVNINWADRDQLRRMRLLPIAGSRERLPEERIS